MPIVWNEARNLILGMGFLFVLLWMPAGGGNAIFGPNGGVALLGRAISGDGDRDRAFVSQVIAGVFRGAGLTLTATVIGAVLCVGVALGLVIGQEVRGRGRTLAAVLTVLSAVPGFLWWVAFVFLGSLVHPTLRFVRTSDGFGSIWRYLAFYGVALFIIGITNASYMYARQSIEEELKRLKGEPFVIAARARGVAGWRFYAHHLAIPAIAVFLERLGGILGNCFIIETLMNIPGICLQGRVAYNDTGARYIIVWGTIAFVCLVFMRMTHILGRLWMIHLDPRLNRPAFGAGGGR